MKYRVSVLNREKISGLLNAGCGVCGWRGEPLPTGGWGSKGGGNPPSQTGGLESYLTHLTHMPNGMQEWRKGVLG